MLSALLLVAAPVAIVSKDAALDFSYRWPAEAAAIPTLDRRFRADALRTKAAALATAQANRKARRHFGTVTPGGDFFHRRWVTSGQSARLLSLQEETSAHTGGAHPNSGTATLLWDRKLGRQTSIDSLLIQAGRWNAPIIQPFCILLERQRRLRRGRPIRNSELFGDCPLKDVTITLTDSDRNRRFDHVQLTADAYVAGPYSEGQYVISLPITDRMIERLRPEFRPSFEPQPPVR